MITPGQFGPISLTSGFLARASFTLTISRIGIPSVIVMMIGSFASIHSKIASAANGGGTNTIKLKGDVTTHSGGLMFGAQWHIGKMVSLDWWILGGHYGVSKGTLSGVPSTSLSANEQDEIRTIINDFENDIPLTKITADVSANNVKAIVDGPWAGVRAGLTIGIRF